MVNANAPLVELFHNRVASGGRKVSANQMLAFRFHGSNHTSAPKPGSSNRDGIGVSVELRLGEQTLRREYRGGEGFAAQNSATMLIGIGARSAVDAVTVRWPSGAVQQLGSLESGQLMSVYEDPSQSPNGELLVREAYAVPGASAALRTRRSVELPRRVFPIHKQAQNGSRPQLLIYTTMATWCASCQAELPHWARLNELFDSADLEIRAVPVDNADTPEKLGRYLKRLKPSYRLLSELSASDVASVNELLLKELGKDGLPASFVTDASGQVLDAGWGAPSVSRIRQLLSERSGAATSRRLAAAPPG